MLAMRDKSGSGVLPARESLRRLVDGGSRAELVAAVKAARSEGWEATREQLLQQVNEMTGLDVSIRLTRVTDELVDLLFHRALRKAGAPEDASRQLGCFATGGYGRGELNPHSDLDVLLLAAKTRPPPWAKTCYQEFSTLLWDTGFKVGGSLRGLDELEGIIKHDFVTATAVIEQRCLHGHIDLQQGMEALLERFRRKRAKAFLQYKVEELQERQGKAGASLFRMEPDLKTNPGCLRDLQLLMNISYMLCGERMLRGLVMIDGMERDDISSLYRCNDFILKLRSLNHFHHNRAADEWTLRDQLRVARQLGYSGTSHLRAVELLMRDYYRLVRHVVQLVDLTISHLNNHGHLGRSLVLIKTRRSLVPGFTTVAGKVYCSDRAVWNDERLCARLMGMFRQTQRSGYRISYVLKRSLGENAHRIDDRHRCDPEAAAAFLEILGDTGSLGQVLEDMHDAEFLGAYLPEFGNVTCLMQFDAYHHYTIDQHTLFSLTNLSKLWKGLLPGLPGMREALREGCRRDLLALALLMHDVGKYMGRGHSQRGADMVTAVGSRLGLPETDIECLYFLVRHHTDLSTASRSRDISDPVFLAELAGLIGTRFRLDMLYCLTYCDVLAVAEGLLTGWQAELLTELYQLLGAEFDRRHLPPGTTPHERFLRELLEHDLDQAEAEAFLRAMPGSYVFQATPADAWRHLALYRQREERCPALAWSASSGSVLLDVLLPPGIGRFSRLCAVLTGRGCDIEDARIWSDSSGVSLCQLRLEASSWVEVDKPAYWATTEEHLVRALADEQHARSLLEQRRKHGLLEHRSADSDFNDPSVRIDQRTSASATILDVQEKDDVGLLSHLCGIIARNGCAIVYASITTMGDVALDVFYVTRERRKLSDAEAAALQADIEQAYDMRARAARFQAGLV
jgi:[protein-PII] uridylyltransferase